MAPLAREAWTAVSQVVQAAWSVPAGWVGTEGSLPAGNGDALAVPVAFAVPVPVASVAGAVLPASDAPVPEAPVSVDAVGDAVAAVGAVVATACAPARRPWPALPDVAVPVPEALVPLLTSAVGDFRVDDEPDDGEPDVLGAELPVAGVLAVPVPVVGTTWAAVG